MTASQSSALEERTRRTAGTSVLLDSVGISFGPAEIVKNIDLQIRPGEFVCLLGPSGCGKSTLLTSIAGFVPLAAGSIECAGENVKGRNRHAGMVFQQSDALFDWMSVAANVSYGPKMRGASKAEQSRIADKFLSMVGLRKAGRKYPGQLSGGMRQRVQIARVLANEPPLILMDEPFGALDAQTRAVMQTELSQIWEETGCTVVFVTHDIDEAIALADRIIVMTAGPSAGIKTSYELDLPRPRERTSPAVMEVYENLRADIREEVAASLRAQGLEEEE
jgi:NitT/TauT family transport system ATP-binding protein